MSPKPRPLPKRFDRRTSRESRKVVKKRHKNRRHTVFSRLSRFRSRVERRSSTLVLQVQRFVWVGIVLGIIGMFIVAMFSPIFTVREMRVLRSDARIDIEQVQRALVPLFGRHMLFVSTLEVKNLLQKDLPELQTVAVQKEYPGLLEVSITLDPIAARLEIAEPDGERNEQDENPDTESGAVSMKRDFLTTEGLYVRYTPAQVVDSSSGTYVIQLVDWGARPTPFTPLIDEEFLQFLLQAQRIIEEEFQQYVSRRTIYLRAQEVHLQTQRYELWFDRKSTLEEQIERYRVFLQSAGVDAASQYVDLRLKDKVVYK